MLFLLLVIFLLLVFLARIIALPLKTSDVSPSLNFRPWQAPPQFIYSPLLKDFQTCTQPYQ